MKIYFENSTKTLFDRGMKFRMEQCEQNDFKFEIANIETVHGKREFYLSIDGIDLPERYKNSGDAFQSLKQIYFSQKARDVYGEKQNKKKIVSSIPTASWEKAFGGVK